MRTLLLLLAQCAVLSACAWGQTEISTSAAIYSIEFDYNLGEHWAEPLRSEPIDVPAIHIPATTRDIGGGWHESQGAYWTCSDKSNVLWTAEDHKHWCHKVQN